MPYRRVTRTYNRSRAPDVTLGTCGFESTGRNNDAVGRFPA